MGEFTEKKAYIDMESQALRRLQDLCARGTLLRDELRAFEAGFGRDFGLRGMFRVCK